MSPWRMMNEWGVPRWNSIPPLSICQTPAEKGENPPALAVEGASPSKTRFSRDWPWGSFVKLVGMARGPMAAAMVGKTIGRGSRRIRFPSMWNVRPDQGRDLCDRQLAPQGAGPGPVSIKFPPARWGLTYYERLAQGLRQLMAGSRKFSLEHMARGDLAALTRRRGGERNPLHPGDRPDGGGRV